MMRSFLVTVLLVTAVAATAVAGTIEGKVSPGKSVVYVDTIQGKTFPAPSQKPVMDQKGLMFSPHVMVVQTGTTVEFMNSDSVQHNAFWPSISGNKKLGHNLGTWPPRLLHSDGDREPLLAAPHRSVEHLGQAVHVPGR